MFFDPLQVWIAGQHLQLVGLVGEVVLRVLEAKKSHRSAVLNSNSIGERPEIMRQVKSVFFHPDFSAQKVLRRQVKIGHSGVMALLQRPKKKG